jgi:hypothetical protein
MEWPAIQNVGFRIYAAMSPLSLIWDDRDNWRMSLRGMLPLQGEGFSSRARAQCRFEIDRTWKVQPPRVWCSSPWVRRDSNWSWHASSEGELCYECDQRWQDDIGAVIANAELLSASDFAAEWILNSVRALLRKHLFAARHGLTEWQDEWPDWSHDPNRMKTQYAAYKARQTADSGKGSQND